MSVERIDNLFDVSPDTAIAAIGMHEGPILVDLDETLYLRNSTEDFLDCARPALLAMLVLRLFDIFKPWRLAGGRKTRDVWRVCAISILFPWTGSRWRARVAELASRHTNQELLAALKTRAEAPTIVTAGFRPIVEPLIAAIGLRARALVAMRMNSLTDRREGKLVLAQRELGADLVSRSMVITDSTDDMDLLRHCHRPLRTLWPKAHYRRALSGVYLPGEYLTRIKRPGERYVWRGVLQEDFAFWVLSSVWLAANPLTHIAGLLLLLLSLWTIYERGYVDNDLVASRFEADPKLSEAFRTSEVATPRIQPWIWALAAAAIGVAILGPQADLQLLALAYGKWVAALVAASLCFWMYNRVDKTTRVWLYPLLQVIRSVSFVVVVPITAVGAAALGAHVLSRWTPYHLYRLAPGRWQNARSELIRLFGFVIISALMASSLGVSLLLNWSALALLGWNVFRARHDIAQVIQGIDRIDRPRAP